MGINCRYYNCDRLGRTARAFTLVELLVVISIIAMLISILAPSLNMIRMRAREILKANNQKQVCLGVISFADDNNGRFPQSLATIGSGKSWNWHDPRKIVNSRAIYDGANRNLSSYLSSYIPDGKQFVCPHTKGNVSIMDDIWEQGEDWDHPATFFPDDYFIASYCLYWNYMGCLDEDGYDLFYGPSRNYGGKCSSDILISDYLGFGHWTQKGAFGSCCKFSGSSTTDRRDNFLLWWHTSKEKTLPEIELKAGYIDGSVRSCSSTSTVKMWVPMVPDGSEVYDENSGMGPGVFYVPKDN